MKNLLLLFFVSIIIFSCTPNETPPENIDYSEAIQGAWKTTFENEEGQMVDIVAIVKDSFIAETFYNTQDKKFYGTLGGGWKVEANRFIFFVDFSSNDSTIIGDTLVSVFDLKGDTIHFEEGDYKTWVRLDAGNTHEMANAWFFAGRMQNGEMSRRALGPRKTMKILSDTRFQWIAYNDETGGFFGTGGGTFTGENGVYTENIEFFSRDSSRVGASLSFDYEIIDGEWHHKGLSSRGDSIYEIWAPYDVLKAYQPETAEE